MKRILFVTFIAVITLVFSCTPLTKEKQDLNLQKDSIKKADSIAKIYSDSVVKANYSGIWMIESYVDDFGAPTKKKYITNSDVINGKFSNSATTNSELNVKIIIESQNVIDIKLFEYAGKNPVKTCVEEGYKIRVKSKTGDVLELKAKNYSDRLSLNKSDSKKLWNLMLKGGKIQFAIIEISEYSSSSYSFDIENADGFENATKKLIE